MDVADQCAIEQSLGLDPKVISAFAVTFGIGDQAVYQLENVFLCVDIGERVVVHGLFEVDGVEEFDSILLLM